MEQIQSVAATTFSERHDLIPLRVGNYLQIVRNSPRQIAIGTMSERIRPAGMRIAR